MGGIGRALSNKHVVELTLLNAGLGKEGLSSIATLVRESPNLKSLDLGQNCIKDRDIAARLFSAVAGVKALGYILLKGAILARMRGYSKPPWRVSRMSGTSTLRTTT